MSHPHNEHRAHKHAKARLSHIAGVHQEPKMHRASGGKVLAKAAPAAKATLRADGGAVKPRADKATRRARGGHIKKHSGKTNVNVIVAPHGAGEGGPPAAPPMPPVGAAPPMPPKPPMPPMPPPGGPPGMGGPPPGLPPGMPPRNVGGRAYKHGGKIFGDADMKPAKYGKGEVGDLWGPGKPRAKGGKACREEGGATTGTPPTTKARDMMEDRSNARIGDFRMRIRAGRDAATRATGGRIDCSQGKTPVQHSGNKSDTQNIGRGKPITFKTGGAIYSDGREGKEMGPKLHAGAASGVGRREKNKLAHSGHWEK